MSTTTGGCEAGAHSIGIDASDRLPRVAAIATPASESAVLITSCSVNVSSDEALMDAYRIGDTAAFQALYGRHRAGLYRFLLRQCGVPALAEELFQDVWLNLIGARERYLPNARFATYLYRIAHNRLIDHFRRSKHRESPATSTDVEDAVDQLQADPSDEPEARLDTKMRVERFAELLANLPAEQREAFVMHEEAGLGLEEIAAATGVSYETAKSRLRYAVAKLRRGLREVL